MLRGSSSFLSSGSQSRNTSRSASRSSLVRENATEERNELESYLATFKDRKRAAKKVTIDWEELLQGGGSDERELGFEVGDGGIGESESAFLKPNTGEAAENRSNAVSKAKSTASEVHVPGANEKAHSLVKNHHIATDVAELVPLDGKIRTLDSSALVEGSSGSVSEVDLSEDTYGDGNLLTNVKMADEFLLSEDESQAAVNGRNKLAAVSRLNERSSSSPQKEVRNQSRAIVDALKSVGDGQMVHGSSVDHLKTTEVQGTLLATQNNKSLSDSESETSSLALKLKNIHSLDELELAVDILESTKDSRLAPDTKGADEESVSTKLRPAVTTAESRSSLVSSFRFSAPGRGAMQTQSVTDRTVESPNRLRVAQSTPERREDDRTDTYTYGDDDFESMAEVEEEEEVIEEEFSEEGQHSASDHEEDSCTTGQQEPIVSEGTGRTSFGEFQSDGETREQSPILASEEDEAGSVGMANSETHSVTNSSEQQTSGSTETQQRDHRTTHTMTRTPGTQDAAVQTPPPLAWPTIGSHYDREYLDPSPIIPHVISADALEAATVYSPSTVALNDMLRAQLMLTRQLIASSRQTLENVSANLGSNHHYTTLEDTKDFIARNKPRVLTTREAKQLIRKEEI